ncbi:MAG: DUF2085 domain-containing protein [Bacteroidetes bacterium]|nr:DUF2085 domain-containing protein [Bacteroidota bacterium]
MVTIALGVWCLFIFMPILFPHSLLSSLTVIFGKGICKLLCHQEEQKLFHFSGCYSLVCARCSGVYLGAFISSVLIFFVQVNDKKGLLLITASCIMLIDVLLTTFGVYPYQKSIAFFTGIFFGSVIFFYFNNAIHSLKLESKTRKVI